MSTIEKLLAPSGIFVDTETMRFEAAANPAREASGGAGIRAAQFVAQVDIRAIITGKGGPKVMNVLHAAQIPVYLFGEGTVRQAVEAFKAGKLPLATGSNAPEGQEGSPAAVEGKVVANEAPLLAGPFRSTPFHLLGRAVVMIMAVASCKGGTGKTTAAVSLALSLADNRKSVPPLFVDCDVEAPNASLFLSPVIEELRQVTLPIPEINPAKCDLCKRCAEVCAYNAIAVVGEQVLVFPEICHVCGSCSLNCPTKAIHEKRDIKGTLERGYAKELGFAQGALNVGVAMSAPAIRQLKQWAIATASRENGRPVILDRLYVLLSIRSRPHGASTIGPVVSIANTFRPSAPRPFGCRSGKLRQAGDLDQAESSGARFQ